MSDQDPHEILDALSAEFQSLRAKLRAGELFLEAHDAFMEEQVPENAYAMKDAADAFRSALQVK